MPAKINEEGRAFVQSVMRDVGADNAVRLAEMLYGPNLSLNNSRKVGKWASGEAAPNMQGTLDLLRLAGRLREPGDAAIPPRLLDDAAILDALERLADLQERQDELLFGLLDREVGQRPARPARRSTSTRRRKSA